MGRPCNVTCPDCRQTRQVTYKMAWRIRKGIATGRCTDCSRVRGSATKRRKPDFLLARGLKLCSQCRTAKPVTEFNRAANHIDGLASRCRPCESVINRERYQAHRDALIVNARKWALANVEKRRAIAREHARRYRRAHPERARARKDKTDFDAILEAHGLVCHICGDAIEPGDLHFDHVIPLSRGGAHNRDNIRPAHARCNLRKGTKLMEEMAA